jgi:hypothetical protein
VVDPDRLKLYRYVTAPEDADYLAIMDRFTDALFAEWSAQDVIAQGVDLPVDTVVARCRYLADNGNLLTIGMSGEAVGIASLPAHLTKSEPTNGHELPSFELSRHPCVHRRTAHPPCA